MSVNLQLESAKMQGMGNCLSDRYFCKAVYYGIVHAGDAGADGNHSQLLA